MFSRAELRALPIFSSLTDESLDFLIAHSADIRLLKGEYVLHEDDTQRALFVLISGRLDVTKFVDGTERVISTRSPGETFGELPLVMNMPFAVSFRASQVARIMCVAGRDYQVVAASEPNLAAAVEAAATGRVEGLQELAASPSPPMLAVIGPQWDNKTHVLREFLERSSIEFDAITSTDASDEQYPQVRLRDGALLTNPSMRQLAEALDLNVVPRHAAYDVAIVGGGPAGLAAAVYGASEGLSTLLVEREAPGGQAGTSSRIENYLGFPYGIAGGDLAHRALEQSRRLGAEIVVTRSVQEIDPASRTLVLDGGGAVEARTIVLATGVSWRHLNIATLDRLRGRGVYYGAAPDEVRTLNGKNVFLVGAGNSAGQAAVNLANFARSVTLLVRGDSLEKSMSRYLIDQLETKENVQVVTHTEVVDVAGSDHLDTISTIDTATDATVKCAADALFIMIGADAETEWLPSQIRRDPSGYVLTGADALKTGEWRIRRDPYLLETTVPGIFAVGDVRSGSIKRVAAGVGEGSMAIALVHQYLTTVTGELT
ncbi:MAG: FAD-dependent oxidoreductase [Candidatus Aquilonibacter sp.]